MNTSFANAGFLGQLVPVVGCFLTAEALMPWGLLWLSDLFLFEVPREAIWAASGSPVLLMVAGFLRILLRRGGATRAVVPGARR